MEKISQLMDGELSRRESKQQIRRLEEERELSESWDTYHLIRDVLRSELDLGPRFARRMHDCLTQEPVVIAPHMRLSHRMVRYSLPLAAGVAGVALVGWLALGIPGSVSVPPPDATVAVAPPPADYLEAHKEFSASTAMHGFASYARTVSHDQATAAR